MLSRYCCLALLCLVSYFLPSEGRNSYQSDLLCKIATAMQIKEVTDTLGSGVYDAFLQYKGHPVSIVVGNNTVGHIGYSLFPKEMRSNIFPSVCNFVERYSLCSELPLYGAKTFKQQMTEDDVNFSIGSISMLPSFWGDSAISVSIETVLDKRYRLTWSKDGKPCCEMTFPIVYELLMGTDIVESQRRLIEDLCREQETSEGDSPSIIGKEQLIKLFEPNFYVLEGDSCYVASLNSNKYYKEGIDGEYNLIFSEMYPVESLANLFTSNEIENDIQAQIKLILYDFKSEVIDIPLVQLLEYFKSKGCKNYFGVIDKDDEQLTIELLVVNNDEGYCHTIKFVCATENIVDRGGVIHGRMNCYIPSSKIRCLFEEGGV